MPPYLIRGINQPLFARWEDGSQPLPPDLHGIELEIVKASSGRAHIDPNANHDPSILTMNKTPPPATAADVANLCGVRPATVSVAFRKNCSIAPAIRQRILEAAAQVGYVPRHGGARPPRGKAKRFIEPPRHETAEAGDEEWLVNLSKVVGQACDRWLASRNLASRGWHRDRRQA